MTFCDIFDPLTLTFAEGSFFFVNLMRDSALPLWCGHRFGRHTRNLFAVMFFIICVVHTKLVAEAAKRNVLHSKLRIHFDQDVRSISQRKLCFPRASMYAQFLRCFIRYS